MQQHAATFFAQAEDAAGADLPQFVKDEFDAFLECGILAHGSLRLHCGDCGHDKLVAFSCKRRGFCPSCGARRMAQTAAHLVDHVIPHVPVRQWVLSLPIPLRLLLAAQPTLVTPVLQVVRRVITRHLLGQAGLKPEEADSGAVTLIQRFGSAANLNIHLHCLVLDGVYRRSIDGTPEFVEVPEPTDKALLAVLHKIITRMMKLLTRRGVLVEEEGSTYMADNDGDSDEARTLRPLQAVACTYRFAFGPRAGQKVLTVQGVMPRDADFKQTLCADIDGFSLHAAVHCGADDRQALEQLCRYITRPALVNERVQTNAAGQVVLELKTPWRDGTTHLVMSPLEFMQRLAALVTRMHPATSSCSGWPLNGSYRSSSRTTSTTAKGRDPVYTNVGFMAAQLGRRVSGNEFSGLVGWTRPISDMRCRELVAPKQSVAHAPRPLTVAAHRQGPWAWLHASDV